MKLMIKDPDKGQDKNNAKTADMWWKDTLHNLKITPDDVKNNEAMREWIDKASTINMMSTYNILNPVMEVLNMRIPGIWVVGLCDDMRSIIGSYFDFESIRYELYMDTDVIVSFGYSIEESHDNIYISHAMRAINALIDRAIATIGRLDDTIIDDTILPEINRTIAYYAAQIGVPEKMITHDISFSRYLQMAAQAPIASKVFTKDLQCLIDTDYGPDAFQNVCMI